MEKCPFWSSKNETFQCSSECPFTITKNKEIEECPFKLLDEENLLKFGEFEDTIEMGDDNIL